MPLEIITIPCLSDNYAFLLHAPGSGLTALVDAPAAAPIKAELDARGWGLDFVFLTHHHWDHIDALDELRQLADYKFVPVLMLTTESAGDVKAQGKQAGATGWIVKPFNPEQLLSTIKRVLG